MVVVVVAVVVVVVTVVVVVVVVVRGCLVVKARTTIVEPLPICSSCSTSDKQNGVNWATHHKTVSENCYDCHLCWGHCYQQLLLLMKQARNCYKRMTFAKCCFGAVTVRGRCHSCSWWCGVIDATVSDAVVLYLFATASLTVIHTSAVVAFAAVVVTAYCLLLLLLLLTAAVVVTAYCLCCYCLLLPLLLLMLLLTAAVVVTAVVVSAAVAMVSALGGGGISSRGSSSFLYWLLLMLLLLLLLLLLFLV